MEPHLQPCFSSFAYAASFLQPRRERQVVADATGVLEQHRGPSTAQSRSLNKWEKAWVVVRRAEQGDLHHGDGWIHGDGQGRDDPPPRLQRRSHLAVRPPRRPRAHHPNVTCMQSLPHMLWQRLAPMAAPQPAGAGWVQARQAPQHRHSEKVRQLVNFVPSNTSMTTNFTQIKQQQSHVDFYGPGDDNYAGLGR